MNNKWQLVEKHKGPWWWPKTIYYVESEFMRIGPFDSLSDAQNELGFLLALEYL